MYVGCACSRASNQNLLTTGRLFRPSPRVDDQDSEVAPAYHHPATPDGSPATEPLALTDLFLSRPHGNGEGRILVPAPRRSLPRSRTVLEVVAGRYGKGDARLAVLTHGWDGEPMRVNRVGRRRLDLPSANLALLLAHPTPSWWPSSGSSSSGRHRGVTPTPSPAFRPTFGCPIGHTQDRRIQCRPPSRVAIANRYQYHAASPETREIHEQVSRATQLMALEFCRTTKTSREQAMALTKLEEVRMWWNAAIALDGQGFDPQEL